MKKQSYNQDIFLLVDKAEGPSLGRSWRRLFQFRNYNFFKDFLFLYPFIKKYRPTFIFSFICFALGMALNLLAPKTIALMIDHGLKERGEFLFYFGIFSGVSLFRIAFDYAQKLSFVKAGENAIRDLRKHLIYLLHHVPLKFYDLNASGRIISRTVNDVTNLSRFFTPSFFNNIGDVFLISGSVGIVCWISPSIGLSLFVLLLILMVILLFFVFHLGKKQRRMRSYLSQSNSYLADSLGGLDILFAQNYIPYWKKQFERIIRLYYMAGHNIVVFWAKFPVIMTLILGLAFTVSLGLGYQQIQQGTLSLGNFVAILSYVTMIFYPLGELANRITELQAAISSMGKIKEILRLESFLEDEDSLAGNLPPVRRNLEGDIVFKDLVFSYHSKTSETDETENHRPLFQNLNLIIPHKKVTAIIGRTGSGKTTLSHLICHLYPWESGDILIGKESLQSLSKKELYRHIGIVTQQLFLFEGTLRENLRLYDENISDQRIFDILGEINLLERVRELPLGLDTKMRKNREKFSLGEKQLLVIARMMLKDPAILIFDEATANLDNYSEYLVQKALRHLFQGRTTLIIAHRLSTIKLADHVVVLEAGQVVEQGSPSELLLQAGHFARYMDFLKEKKDF